MRSGPHCGPYTLRAASRAGATEKKCAGGAETACRLRLVQSPAATIPFFASAADADPDVGTASWAYRRRARRLRHRFRGDPAGLHASLKTLVTEVDAAAEPRAARRSVFGARRVRAHVVEPVVQQTTRAEPVELAEPPRSSDVGDGVRSVLNAPADVVDGFAALVRAALDEGIIRHSRRQSLLRRAGRLGIGRFEATLIIAAVEHRRRGYAGAGGEVLPPVKRRSVGVVVGAVLLVEVAAGLVLWVFV